MKKIATIIVTYNGARWIEQCLTHLSASFLPTEIIIVDNASADHTLQLLHPFSDRIILIRSDKNLGFGAANTIGIQKAMELGMEYVFLLNQDAYVKNDCISNLYTSSIQFPEYGILSPVQLNSGGIEPDVTFKNQLTRNIRQLPAFSFFEQVNQHPNLTPWTVRFVGAAAWFLPVQVIKKVGLFHPVFYHYGEDNNYAARVQYFGYKIGVLNSALVIHDREQRKDLSKFLPAKLRSFPLHLLLDIRKPLPVAWLTGLNQLKLIWRRLRKISGHEHEKIYGETRKWFFERFRETLEIRSKLKRGND